MLKPFSQNTDFQMTLITQQWHCKCGKKQKKRNWDFFLPFKKTLLAFLLFNKEQSCTHSCAEDYPTLFSIIGKSFAIRTQYYICTTFKKIEFMSFTILSACRLILSILKACKTKGEKVYLPGFLYLGLVIF